MSHAEDETATRRTLALEWREVQHHVDWGHAPGVSDYQNASVSGKSLADSGHWAIHARDRHVLPLAAKRAASTPEAGLSLLSLGCGAGHIDASLVGQFGWPITRFVGTDYDEALRARAAESFTRFPGCSSEFRAIDFNNPGRAVEQFDVVFCCHSIHHASDLEVFLPFINACMKDDGIFVGLDYFGPTRFQPEYDVRQVIEELFRILPPELRRNLRNAGIGIEEQFVMDTIAAVGAADPSEAVRSADLRSLLFSSFPVREIRPMGGTILRWLLQDRAGNFRHDDPCHVAISRLLQYIEAEMIRSGRIRSDDLFFVLGKSDRLG